MKIDTADNFSSQIVNILEAIPDNFESSWESGREDFIVDVSLQRELLSALEKYEVYDFIEVIVASLFRDHTSYEPEHQKILLLHMIFCSRVKENRILIEKAITVYLNLTADYRSIPFDIAVIISEFLLEKNMRAFFLDLSIILSEDFTENSIDVNPDSADTTKDDLASLYEKIATSRQCLTIRENLISSICMKIAWQLSGKESCLDQLKSFNSQRAELEKKNKKSLYHKKTRIVFLVQPGLDTFLEDVINSISEQFDVKKVLISNSLQIEEHVKWADICWFEWCDDLIVNASQYDIFKDKKVICRLHSYEAFLNYPAKVNWNNVDKIIFVAEHIRDFVVETTKSINVDKTVVIPNGIDLSKYSFKARKPGYNIAYVGYINYKKGPMLLLHTFKAIYDQDPRYRLYIAGTFQDDRDILYYRQMIDELGLQENVFHDGWQNDVNGWLEDKNYIICTSVLESQNLSVMQAMAKGIKPVVHNFVGARGIYAPGYIWNTIGQAVEMIKEKKYSSEEYRNFVAEKYSSIQAAEKFRDLLSIE